ncbi:MAG TPA: hypothetical protein VFW09_10475 [Solirubrobacteraceae bacterium]|nr:hypothetical protein [Solirubrobacteraceae bacterium]
MADVYVVTLIVELAGVRAAEAAAALLAEDAVVTVRIADGGAPSVVRLDVDAVDEHHAAATARVLASAVARDRGWRISIRSAGAERDRERAWVIGHDHGQM